MSDRRHRPGGCLLLLVGVAALVAAALLAVQKLGLDLRLRDQAAQTADAVERQMAGSGVASPGAKLELDALEGQAASVSGETYLGILEVPALGLRLALDAGAADGSLSRHAATLYNGSLPEAAGVVVAGDRTPVVFGNLGRLQPGDAISLTGMDGIRYDFRVSAVVTTAPTDDDALVGEGLTLFVSTFSGAERTVVTCVRS